MVKSPTCLNMTIRPYRLGLNICSLLLMAHPGLGMFLYKRLLHIGKFSQTSH